MAKYPLCIIITPYMTLRILSTTVQHSTVVIHIPDMVVRGNVYCFGLIKDYLYDTIDSFKAVLEINL